MKLAAHASLSFWNALPAAQRARTLALDRFASFPLRVEAGRYTADPNNKEYRRGTFDAVAGGAVLRDGTSAWLQFLREGLRLPDDQLLFGQLQSRLMVNMAGGVLENGGLCLDRRTGLPYLPGSAVKGCARRAALAALHEWCECETGVRPGDEQDGQDNLFQAACKPFQTKAAMLTAIARVLGWGEQDWKVRADFRSDEDWENNRPDFAWACGDDWETTRVETLKLLGGASALGARAPHSNDFSGSVSFLPAYPVDLGQTGPVEGLSLGVPTLGELQPDVVTMHHRIYYSAEPDRLRQPDKWQEWQEHRSAPDTEEPVPVSFPAVAPGHVFAFALAPLRGAKDALVGHARTWLACGLATFGLGAKTSAGYGWFEDVTDTMSERNRQAREAEAIVNARANLQPDPQLIEKLRGMKEPDLRGQINPFAIEERFWTQKDERLQLSVLHFLCVTAPELLAADRANPKSKIAKAIASLAAKFPHVASQKL